MPPHKFVASQGLNIIRENKIVSFFKYFWKENKRENLVVHPPAPPTKPPINIPYTQNIAITAFFFSHPWCVIVYERCKEEKKQKI